MIYAANQSGDDDESADDRYARERDEAIADELNDKDEYPPENID